MQISPPRDAGWFLSLPLSLTPNRRRKKKEEEWKAKDIKPPYGSLARVLTNYSWTVENILGQLFSLGPEELSLPTQHPFKPGSLQTQSQLETCQKSAHVDKADVPAMQTVLHASLPTFCMCHMYSSECWCGQGVTRWAVGKVRIGCMFPCHALGSSISRGCWDRNPGSFWKSLVGLLDDAWSNLP